MSLILTRTFLWLIAPALWLGSSFAYAQGILTPKPFQQGKTSNFGYYEYLPANYQEDSTAQFPLLIYLSGLGSKGDGVDDLKIILDEGLGKLIAEGEEFPFLVMMPQSWSGFWGVKNIDTYLDYIRENYRVDQSRIYITGFSAGGQGAFEYAVASPNKVTAIIPISGRGENLDICSMVNVPVWAFHNVDDPAFSSNFSIIPINKLNNCNPFPATNAKLTIYPVTGHDAWTKTYNGSGMGTEDATYDAFDQNIFDWMLQFAKDTVIADVGEDKVIFQPQTSLEVEAYAASYNGNHTYDWQQLDGPEIEIQNSTSSKLFIEAMPVGRYTFTVTAENDFREMTTDTVKVWVRPPNEAPSVTMADNGVVILPIDSVTLLGFINDPESDPFSLIWEQQEGAEGVILQFDSAQSDSAQLVVKNLREGEYSFQLSAIDEYDSVGIQSVRLTVISRTSEAIEKLPYNNSFEEIDEEGWQGYGPSNSWEQGQPAGSVVNEASDESQVWATNLTGDYQSKESSFLLSPVFDFSNLSNDPTIRYDIWADIAPNDSIYLSITSDQGATWKSFPLVNEKSNDEWTSVSHILEGTAGKESVIFRIGLESNNTEGYEGVAIDNMTVCSAGSITSLTDTMVVEGESLEVPIELDNSDITEVTYQATSSNQDILPDENMTISEGILKITSLPQTEGETEITISTTDVCVNSTTFILNVARVTALDKPDQLSQVQLYPNPSTGYYQIESEDAIREARIYSPTGQLLERYTKSANARRELSFDIYSQPNGIYYLQVETDRNVLTRKVIKY